MKFIRLAAVTAAAALCVLRAQDDNEKQQKPPTEIPDFNHLDEYIYVPKSNLNFGYRFSTGVKAHFGGHATVQPSVPPPNRTSLNVDRVYQDGEVGPDTRTFSVDLGNGTNGSQATNAADGKTTNWTYTDASQVTSDDFIQFHTYSADNVLSESALGKNGKANVGMEVFVSHDMSHLTKHLEWKLFGGMAINDIQSATFATVGSRVTTTTDTYDLYGQTPPPPQSGSSNTTVSTDSSGNSSTVGSTVPISSAPLVWNQITQTDVAGNLTEHFKLHGAYATFRAGPQLMYDFNDHLKFSVSAGPALLFAGSLLEVNEAFTPPTGQGIIDTITNTTNKLLIGYYIDATVQYDLSERTGFYLGAFDQGATGYHQTASSPNGVFTTKVDFDNQEGVRTGLAYKF